MVAQKKQVSKKSEKKSKFLYDHVVKCGWGGEVRLCSVPLKLIFFVCFSSTEKGFGEHQCSFGFGHEIRQILLGI